MSYDFFGLCNVDPPGDVDHLCFSNLLLPTDSVPLCNYSSGDIPPNPVTGTFGATGSWVVLNGLNPAKGGWAVAVRVYASLMGGTDGGITYATITFTDKNIHGDTVTVGFSSGVVYDTIYEPSSGLYQSNEYQVPLALYTSCFNTCDAQAIANVVGGTAPYTYKWSDPSIPNQPNVTLCKGSYSLVVTDALGCTASTTVDVLSPPAIIIDSVVYTPTIKCHGIKTAKIRIGAHGGNGTIRYSDDGGATYNHTGIFNGLGAGTYNLIIKDANGCHVDSTIKITEPAPIIIKDSVINLSCNGVANGEIHLKTSGGTAPFLYSYDAGTTYTLNADTTGLGPNTYTLFAKDANFCIKAGDTIKMAYPPLLVYDSLHFVKRILCNSDSATVKVYAHGGTGNLLYSANGGASWSTDSIFTKLGPGTFHFDVKDQNNCIKTGDSLVLVNPAAIVISKVDSNNVSCNGLTNGSIKITASGGSTGLIYSIDGGITYLANAGVFLNLAMGSYKVIVADSFACHNSFGTVTITEPAPIVLKDSIISPSCNGASNGEIHLKTSGGTAPFLYSYDNGTTFTSSADTIGLGPNTYTLFAKDANACIQAGDTVKIADPPLLVYDSLRIVNPILCNGDSANVKVYAHGGTGSLQYSSNGGASWNTDSLFVKLAPGTYHFDVKDQNNCIKTGDSLVLVNPSAILISKVDSVNVSCNGLANGSIKITASGGSTGLIYSIDGGITFLPNGGLFSNLATGTYKLIVADSLACQNSFGKVTLTEPAPIVIKDSVISINCNGAANGEIHLKASGGTAPYIYSYNNGLTYTINADTLGLAPATYTIFAKDANACKQAGDTLNLKDPVLLVYDSLHMVKKILCSGDSASVKVYAHGGTGNLLYSSNGGGNWSTDSNFVKLGPGTYHFAVKDQNSCIKTGDSLKLVNPIPITITKVDSANISCNGLTNGSLKITASGGSTGLIYSINGGTTYLANGGVFLNLAAGNYSIIVADSLACHNTFGTVTINEPALLDLGTISITNVSCTGKTDGKIRVLPSGGTSPYNYILKHNGLAIDSMRSASFALFTNLPPDSTYAVILNDTAGCGPVTSVTLTVSEPNKLIFDSVSVQQISCPGTKNGSVNIYGHGGTPFVPGSPFQYTINGGTSWSDTVPFISLDQGVYQTGIRDARGCSVFGDTVTLKNPPLISVDSITVLNIAGCFGDSTGKLVIHASGGSGKLQYTMGAQWYNSNVIDSLPAGFYNISVRDSLGCSVSGPGTAISQPNAITAVLKKRDPVNVNNGAIFFTNITGGSGVYNFFSASFAGNTFTSLVDSITSLGKGFYNTLVKDSHGCSSHDTITLGLTPPLDVSFTVTDVTCFGLKNGLIIFNPGPGATAPVKYSINGGLNYSYNDTFRNLDKGNYTLLAVDTTGKFILVDTVIHSPSQIKVNVVSRTDANCKFLLPGTSDFGSISITNISGGAGGYTYLWKNSNGQNVGNTNTANGLVAGTYTVDISDQKNCSIIYTDSISYDITKTVSLIRQNDTSTCYNSELTLTANTVNATSFLWQGLPKLDTLSLSNTFSFAAKDSIIVKLLVWNTFNCAAIDTFKINTKPFIGLILPADTISMLGGTSMNIPLQLKNPSNAATFLWTPATELKDASVQNPLFTPVNKSQEYYRFIVDATSTMGCEETDTANIAVFWELIVPSGFSPNGDLVNDTWIIKAAYIAPVTVEVFNRWGEHVFMASPYKNDWDGTYHGKPLPVGTYYFVITINTGTTKKTISGPLTIVR